MERTLRWQRTASVASASWLLYPAWVALFFVWIALRALEALLERLVGKA